METTALEDSLETFALKLSLSTTFRFFKNIQFYFFKLSIRTKYEACGIY